MALANAATPPIRQVTCRLASTRPIHGVTWRPVTTFASDRGGRPPATRMEMSGRAATQCILVVMLAVALIHCIRVVTKMTRQRSHRAFVVAVLVAPWLCTAPVAAQYTFGVCENDIVWRATVREWSVNGFRVNRADVEGIPGGLGFAVGWTAEQVWIATPAHVAYGSAKSGTSTTELMARQRSAWEGLEVRRLDGDGGVLDLCSGQDSLKGYGPVLPAAPPKHDLAFVCVRRPTGLYLQRELAAMQVRSADEYRMLGAADQPPPESLSGRLRAVSEGEDRYLELLPGGGVLPEEGLSGAMVVTPAGLAGLYLGWADRGIALDLEVMRQEALDKDVLWSLRPREHYDCMAEREVCFVIVSPLRPRELVAESRTRRAVVSIGDSDTCLSLNEGRYSLSPRGGRVRCEPFGFSVPGGASTLTTEIQCRPDLAGTWSAGALGDLLCTQGQYGVAQCTGLVGFGRGMFSGTLDGKGEHIELKGSFRSTYPTDVHGELDWKDGTIAGEIELIGAGTDPIYLILRAVP